MTIWHQGPDVIENEVVEITLEIDTVVPSQGDIHVYILPETLVAYYVHRGNFKDFQIGHKILSNWVDVNSYCTTGGYREIYLKHDSSYLSNSETEIQFPVEKITTS